MRCINSSSNSECSIEEPCAGKSHAGFCGGKHNKKLELSNNLILNLI